MKICGKDFKKSRKVIQFRKNPSLSKNLLLHPLPLNDLKMMQNDAVAETMRIKKSSRFIIPAGKMMQNDDIDETATLTFFPKFKPSRRESDISCRGKMMHTTRYKLSGQKIHFSFF